MANRQPQTFESLELFALLCSLFGALSIGFGALITLYSVLEGTNVAGLVIALSPAMAGFGLLVTARILRVAREVAIYCHRANVDQQSVDPLVN